MPEAILLSDALFADFLPKRLRESNKKDYGKAVVIGGSKAFGGAPLLSYNAVAALKMGAGYAYLYVPESLYSIYVGREPAIIVQGLRENPDGSFFFDEREIDAIIADKPTSIAFGMGATVGQDIAAMALRLANRYEGRLILDADALNSLARYAPKFLGVHQPIITPHHGEFARLSGIAASLIDQEPQQLAEVYARKHRLIVVLKGADTYITDGTTTYLNKAGTPALAKAGSGDTLSGILAGLEALPSQVDPLLTAAFACYLFGKAAEVAAAKTNEYSLLPEDVDKQISESLTQFIEK